MAAPVQASPLIPQPLRLSTAPDALDVFVVQNVLITAWHKTATAEIAEELDALVAPQRKRYPSGLSTIHLGQIRLIELDARTRATFVRLIKAQDNAIKTTAIVCNLTGFWASTLRSIVTGLLVLARTRIDLRVQSCAEEVLTWLPEAHAKATGVQIDPGELRRVITHAEALVTADRR